MTPPIVYSLKNAVSPHYANDTKHTAMVKEHMRYSLRRWIAEQIVDDERSFVVRTTPPAILDSEDYLSGLTWGAHAMVVLLRAEDAQPGEYALWPENWPEGKITYQTDGDLRHFRPHRLPLFGIVVAERIS